MKVDALFVPIVAGASVDSGEYKTCNKKLKKISETN